MATMLDWAKRYVELGFSVIPVGKDKRPAVPWAEFQTRRPSGDELEAWWGKDASWGIGIVCGAISGLSIIDIDPRNGGTGENLEPVVVVQTGGGGWHYYYKYNPAVVSGTTLKNGIDFKSDGGYVVAPPSMHQSGNRYEWVMNFEREILPDFPEEMLKLHAKHAENKVDLSTLPGAVQGQRNEHATRIAGVILAGTKRALWEEVGWKSFVAWNKEKNTPPLSDRELRSVWNNIAKKESKNPERQEESNPDEVPFLNLTEVTELGYRTIRETNPNDIISTGYQMLDNAITGLFPGELAVVGGETGSGKTTFVTNMSLRISKKHQVCIFALEDRLEEYGQKALFFQINKTLRLNRVAPIGWNEYRTNTLDFDGVLSGYVEAARFELANGNLLFPKIEHQMTIDLLEKLVQKAADRGVKMCVIDHLHFFNLMTKDNNRAAFIESVMQRIKTLANRTRMAIILVAHYKKLEGKRPGVDSFKDSVSIAQTANYVINLWRDRTPGVDNMKTYFSIPKARNPNGESTFVADYDKVVSDFVNFSLDIKQEPKQVWSSK